MANMIEQNPIAGASVYGVEQYSYTVNGVAGKDYAAAKTQAVLSLYLNLTLLAHPDRKTGRTLAAELLNTCQVPAIRSILQKKYRVLKYLNYLHINKETWDNLLNSDLYNALRKKLSFH